MLITKPLFLNFKQTGTVEDYHTSFEQLCNCVNGLHKDTILNYFLSGLMNEIQQELAILRPQTIIDAIGLAKLVEAKIKDGNPVSFIRHCPSSLPSLAPPVMFSTIPASRPLLPSCFPVPKQPVNIAIRRLSPNVIQERRSKGLCFNYDERFQPDHKCKAPQFLTILTHTVPCDSELTTPPLVPSEIQPETILTDPLVTHPEDPPLPTMLFPHSDP
ncbi:UNVERIFIED_CONTAM: hypothetical protein Slati_4558300 [Sesamum latifolium]|uniref:Retrotransposon gag domain-containing protein n=1 Tax=Sesamum latifolium TaxID=2727402 RepID=A0AAW2S2V8_9LAMI